MTSLALESTAIASTVERAIAGDEIAFARLVAAQTVRSGPAGPWRR